MCLNAPNAPVSAIDHAPGGSKKERCADRAGLNDGIKVVADALHKKGLKMGIYTAPHGLTCGGYWGMLGHETTDSAMYAGWGIGKRPPHPACPCP